VGRVVHTEKLIAEPAAEKSLDAAIGSQAKNALLGSVKSGNVILWGIWFLLR